MAEPSFLEKLWRSLRRTKVLLAMTFITGSLHAQHTNQEIGFSFAYAGQVPIVRSNNDQTGFFRQPLIWNLRYQITTNYVQSLALVLEGVTEQRNRTDLWPNNYASSNSGAYNADIAERLYMTTIGLEGSRTFIRTDIFRLGVGLSLSYGLGGTTATVRKINNGSQQTFESLDAWSGFLISAFLRGRFTVYSNNALDIGVTVAVRIWGFPSIGPLTVSENSYNGPMLRSIFDIGYLAGVSVGLK